MSDPGWPPWVSRPPSIDELVTDDGVPMESERHRAQMNLLIESLNLAWVHRRDFYCGGNMFLYYSALQAKKNDFRGPDVFVVLDTERRERKAWVMWEEDGKHPDVIIELTSESTAAVDRGEKKRIYARVVNVPEYFIYDPLTGALEGYQLDIQRREYDLVAPGANGRYASHRLGLELGIWHGRHADCDGPWLRWYTPDGKLLSTPREAHAEAEARRAEAEARRTEAEARRAEAEARRTEAEQRASDLAERLAAYERQFGKLPDDQR